MEVASFLAVVLALSLMYGVNCSWESNNKRLDVLENTVQTFSGRFDLFEQHISMEKTYLRMQQDRQLLSLKIELVSNIRQHVTQTLSEILSGDSIENMIRSRVISETRHLKRDNHRMKRQLHGMKETLERVHVDNKMIRDALLGDGREKNEWITCSKCNESELLDSKLSQLDRRLSELNRTVIDQCDIRKPPRNETDFPVETTTPTSSSISPSHTTLQSTSAPPVETGRILIAPLWSGSKHQFRYLNINDNSLNMYSYLRLKKVTSVAYVSKINSLLIGLSKPYKIISSKFKSTGFQTVQRNVGTYGMAADEERGVVFLTTSYPGWAISRMTLQGTNFSLVVSLRGFGDYPSAIAVNPGTEIIYACNYNKLFTVKYDGSGLTTLDTGTGMYALTLDLSNSLIYYGKKTNFNKLMKLPLSTNTTSEVARFSFPLYDLIYYRDRVYYTSGWSTPSKLGAVSVGRNRESRTIKIVKVNRVHTFAICLIP